MVNDDPAQNMARLQAALLTRNPYHRGLGAMKQKQSEQTGGCMEVEDKTVRYTQSNIKVRVKQLKIGRLPGGSYLRKSRMKKKRMKFERKINSIIDLLNDKLESKYIKSMTYDMNNFYAWRCNE